MLPYGTVRYPRNFKKKKRYYSDYANSLRYGTVRTLVSIRISQLRTYTHGTYISNKVKNYREYGYGTVRTYADWICHYVSTYIRTYVIRIPHRIIIPNASFILHSHQYQLHIINFIKHLLHSSKRTSYFIPYNIA